MKQNNFWLAGEKDKGSSANEYGEQTERAEQARQEQLKQEQLQADLLHISQSVQGRRFLKELLWETGVFAEIPVGNANVYAYLEGKRSLGLMLYHRLYALGANYLIQIQEQE